MAESSYALTQYANAAMLYLRSAKTEEGSMHDQWALSARLKAAEALVKAALYDDATTVYQQLLKLTGNASRKAMIEQEMQHIYLLKNAHRVGDAQPSAR
jgi:HEPN domain-containing protein